VVFISWFEEHPAAAKVTNATIMAANSVFLFIIGSLLKGKVDMVTNHLSIGRFFMRKED
jgi:hypothetical protein